MDASRAYIAVNDAAQAAKYNRFELERAHALGLPVYMTVENDGHPDPDWRVSEPRVVAGGPPGSHYELLVTARPESLAPGSPEQRHFCVPLLRARGLDDLFELTDPEADRYDFYQLDQQSRVIAVLTHSACYGPEFSTAKVMPYFVGAIPEIDVLKLRAQQLHGRELQRVLGIE